MVLRRVVIWLPARVFIFAGGATGNKQWNNKDNIFHFNQEFQRIVLD